MYKVPSTVTAIYWGLLNMFLFYRMCELHCLDVWYYLYTLNLHQKRIFFSEKEW